MGAYRAELLKLRRRPATWVLVAVAAGVVLVFSYLFLYVVIGVIGTGDATADAFSSGFLSQLLPEQLAGSYVEQAATAAPIALILGVLAMGSEYGWRTVRLMVTQRPRRVPLLLAKLAALVTAAAGIAVAVCAAATAASVLIAVIEGQPVALPPAGDLLTGFGAAVLVLGTWSAFGLMLGVVCKGTGLPIGIGLFWALVVESILSLPFPQLDGVRSWLLSTNASALGQGLGSGSDPLQDLGALFGVGAGEIAPLQAAIVLVVYAVLFSGIATAVFARREIT